MAITVAVIAPNADQRQVVTRAINAMPDLYVVRHADDLSALRELPVLPHVVVLGLPHLAVYTSTDRFWKALTWIRKTAPTSRLAVWFEDYAPGATANLRDRGVAGILQWSDVRADAWPKLVRTLFAGSPYWSRPFDTLDLSQPKAAPVSSDASPSGE